MKLRLLPMQTKSTQALKKNLRALLCLLVCRPCLFEGRIKVWIRGTTGSDIFASVLWFRWVKHTCGKVCVLTLFARKPAYGKSYHCPKAA
jgi:hypothetical protein